MSTQQVAVVTGAGSGIGRAAATALGAAGFAVVLAGRRPDPLAETAAAIDADTRVVPTDVADEGSVADLFDAAVEEFGRVDVLFNNAGISAPVARIDQVALADWQRVVDVNLTGMFLCAREAFARMLAQRPGGGLIINNGSISAVTPRPHAAAYTVTKHGVSGLTKQLALDGRRYGIRCGQLDVGNAASEMTERMGAGVLQPDGELRPEPTMDVDAVARAVVLMASLPPDAVVPTMTVMAPQMPFQGRG